mgnify:CR=1 FL=1
MQAGRIDHPVRIDKTHRTAGDRTSKAKGGVARQRLDEAAAAETLALFAEMGDGEPV